MHSFHFTRKVNDPVDGERVFHVSVIHNGDWSGDVCLNVVSAPPDAVDERAAESWFARLSESERVRLTSEATINAALLLNGDIDPDGLPWRVARVLGSAIAQSVCRYLHSKAVSAAETLWLPRTP